ncbi:orotidine-5'-phosphate decarboxylase [Campylobacter corcagiensis]|uniref:Orotidine 5'-phosphate decarboxylase n=1 Tax=Campylobacter corcagiensis TaxID=1448857 RepID=A0A7M1LG97_9BACT|nr:orotidine-5'-phosphate decarboxylase [Campylobacter corcagiensis]QKF64218.1 orotidine-5'-phosphate decarboxylase [Campylobacter corcagiensis]QOQ87588.1 orotidine-5'-phosphate decarboxylase [Campylobacter corcagiensis]
MKLCVALDMETKKQNLDLAMKLKGLDIWLKVGLRSYLRDGACFVKSLKNMGFKVFLDLKIYDIPNTMADACEVCADLGVDMINLHASSGKKAMVAVMERLSRLNSKPLVLSVSALTSFSDDEFSEIYGMSINSAVRNMAIFTQNAGLDGMVCSVFESAMIKDVAGENFITLTPGIRPFGKSSDDQVRVANLEMAKSQKSDFIVVGRPIYEAKDPLKATFEILKGIE